MTMLNDLLEEELFLPERYRSMSEEELVEKITAIKERLGEKLFIPGHASNRRCIVSIWF